MFGGHRQNAGTEKESAKDSVGTLRRLLPYFRPFAGLLIVVGVLLVLNSVLDVAGALPDRRRRRPVHRAQATTRVRPGWPGSRRRACEPQHGLTAVMILLLVTYLLRWLLDVPDSST